MRAWYEDNVVQTGSLDKYSVSFGSVSSRKILSASFQGKIKVTMRTSKWCFFASCCYTLCP